MKAHTTHLTLRHDERGLTLVEAMIALVVFSLGILAVVQLFPTGARSQVQDALLTDGNQFAQEKIEQLVGLPWTDAALTLGRHPGGTATESLGGGRWQRWYEVAAVPGLDNLRKVTVTVTWTGAARATRSVTAVTYVHR